MLDFGLLPPEINSGRMYSGPGPGPMLAAAEAWDGLAAELGIAFTGYGSTITELTGGPWIGPTSVTMLAAVTPYINWLSTTAAQAEETANQARAAVAAYEAAFAMTVPPPVIEANRALLMALIATNFFGQNTPAIMATEALYAEMWAQDAAAMYGYTGASAAASQVTPFNTPQQTTTPGGLAGQSAAVTQAASTPAGTSAQTTASTTPQLVSASAVSQAVQQPSSVTTSTSSTTSTASLSDLFGPNGLNILGSSGWLANVMGGAGLAVGNQGLANADTNWPYFPTGIMQFCNKLRSRSVTRRPRTQPCARWRATAPGGDRRLGFPGGPMERVGQCGSGWRDRGLVGAVELVPRLPRRLSPTAPAGLVGTPANGGSSALLRGVALNGAGTGRRSAGFVHRYGFRHAVMPRPPSAG